MPFQPLAFSTLRRRLPLVIVLALLGALLPWAARPARAAQIDIIGPTGSGEFGKSITVLPNGNFVVVDTTYDAGTTANVGAVHLYSGISGALISTLTGSSSEDQVGSGGIILLGNGNYLVGSPKWDNGTLSNAGALTWVSATDGVSGTVSSTNSLVCPNSSCNMGSQTNVSALSNGNYLVNTAFWSNGTTLGAGAVTWGDGSTGVTGTISSSNSLVGTSAFDIVGSSKPKMLANGNYVVISSNWDNGALADVGAVTWGDGTTGITGTVSSANSIVGLNANDQIGSESVLVLSDGAYIINSPSWDLGSTVDVGAVTWVDSTTTISGTVSSSNSLVGSTANDKIGSRGAVRLGNGNYLVPTTSWDNGALANAGAVTWGDGTTGITGTVSSANSLVGSQASDQVGRSIWTLPNGNYLVSSIFWDNGTIVDAGAATWGDGTTGITGTISSANSLVGASQSDEVGSSITRLSNGNYVVHSSKWDDGALADVGAVTWGDGTTGITGTVSSANSLIGATASDQVGSQGYALSNGNYLVQSSSWDNGALADVGAVTWGDGTTGITGTVSSANSLVGATAGDKVGTLISELTNGNYIVMAYMWDDGALVDVGAATWGDGTAGITGTVSRANSLVGATVGDQVGNGGIAALANGNYLVGSYRFDNGTIVDAGALTWGNGTTGVTGTVSSANSLVGSSTDEQVYNSGTLLSSGDFVMVTDRWDSGALANVGAVSWLDGSVAASGPITTTPTIVGQVAGGGPSVEVFYDLTFDHAIVGWPSENRVTLFDNPFGPSLYPLSVSVTGAGAGTVSSSPSGISCGATCAARFAEGALVTLTATAEPDSIFMGWGGACSGMGTCQVTMDAVRSVSATFAPLYRIRLPLVLRPEP